MTNVIAVELLIDSGAVQIRNLNNKDEKPFQYSSGWFGPGYVMIKGLVGQKHIIQFLVDYLAAKIINNDVHKKFDFIAANATGGMIPGWMLSEKLTELVGYDIPYVYVRNTRKIGGHGEHITGCQNNPYIKPGMRALIFEELVNFAETTYNSSIVVRQEGFEVTQAATILYYNNPVAASKLNELSVNMTYLLTLSEILNIARSYNLFPSEVIDDYESYLHDPIEWNNRHGYKRVEI